MDKYITFDEFHIRECAKRGAKIAGDSVIFGNPVDPYSLKHVLALLAIFVETSPNLCAEAKHLSDQRAAQAVEIEKLKEALAHNEWGEFWHKQFDLILHHYNTLILQCNDALGKDLAPIEIPKEIARLQGIIKYFNALATDMEGDTE